MLANIPTVSNPLATRTATAPLKLDPELFLSKLPKCSVMLFSLTMENSKIWAWSVCILCMAQPMLDTAMTVASIFKVYQKYVLTWWIFMMADEILKMYIFRWFVSCPFGYWRCISQVALLPQLSPVIVCIIVEIQRNPLCR